MIPPPRLPAPTAHASASTDVTPSQDFKSATTGVAAKAMRNELNRMIQGIPAEEGEYKKARSFVLLASSG